jgi:hypothetical protein
MGCGCPPPFPVPVAMHGGSIIRSPLPTEAQSRSSRPLPQDRQPSRWVDSTATRTTRSHRRPVRIAPLAQARRGGVSYIEKRLRELADEFGAKSAAPQLFGQVPQVGEALLTLLHS